MGWVGSKKNRPRDLLIWNEKRDRKVPEEIINNFYTALSNSNFGPNLAEGFASIIEILNNETKLREDIDHALNSISKKITQRKNKEMQKDLHGYSRLLG